MITNTFKIVDIEDGIDVWEGHAKTLYLQLEGKGVFKVAAMFEVMNLRELWIERNAYIGGSATIVYPYHSVEGYPTHCVVDALVPNPDYNRSITPFDKNDAIRVYQDIGREVRQG